jgi:hypothetical protein
MTGQNNPSFISFYQEGFTMSHIKGCITSRSINIYYANNEISAYYIDNICIHKDVNKNINYKLIQTHEFNQRSRNPVIKVSLLKKEINLVDGVVPLLKYDTYLYKLSPYNNKQRPKLPYKVTCVRIMKTNLDIFSDFLDKIKLKELISFKFVAIPDLGNILALLHGEEYYIYCLCHGKDKLGYYFFKNSRIIYDGVNGLNGNTLQMTGSYNNTKSIDLFLLGYQYALNSIRKVHTFDMLLVENLSHNYLLLGKEKTSQNFVLKYKCAYYLYNYIIPKMPLQSNNCFLLL